MKCYPPFNVLIADDHKIITEGLSRILADEAIIGNILVANDGKMAVALISTNDIDVVIMDINMPLLNGHDATRLIKKDKPFIKIIVVSMLSDASIVRKMLKAGTDAFINKDTGKEEILSAIEKVTNGEKYISPGITADYFFHLDDRNITDQTTEKHLSPREIEIIGYIAEGLTNNEIAARLFLSVSTVDTHRKNMLTKLKLKNTAALVKYAAEHKLL